MKINWDKVKKNDIEWTTTSIVDKCDNKEQCKSDYIEWSAETSCAQFGYAQSAQGAVNYIIFLQGLS